MCLDLEQALETLNEGYQDGEDHFYIHEQRARGEESLSGGRSALSMVRSLRMMGNCSALGRET